MAPFFQCTTINFEAYLKGQFNLFLIDCKFTDVVKMKQEKQANKIDEEKSIREKKHRLILSIPDVIS
jgi:hypothetical protein